MNVLILSAAEARVLAVLVEKAALTPQYYPMTVNAVMLAANQKTVRNPVMNLSEGDTGAALIRLERDGLASRDDRSGRVPKWRHLMQHQLLLKPHELAVLATLMLRGPQTGSELRANAAGIGGPSDAEGLKQVVSSLTDRAQPLVVEIGRAPGQKEGRITHLLCGTPSIPAGPRVLPGVDEGAAPESTEASDLETRLRLLESRVAELEQRLSHWLDSFQKS